MKPIGGRKTRYVIQYLKNLIYNGGIGVGVLLPGEEKLAAQLSVSRVTVRRALKSLAEAGAVKPVTGRGWRVLPTEATARSNRRRPVFGISLRSPQRNWWAYYSEAIRGCQASVAHFGGNCVLLPSGIDAPERKEIIRSVEELKIDGLVYVHRNRMEDKELVKKVRSMGCQVVLAFCAEPEVELDVISVDWQSALRRLVRHAVDSGHNRIALVGTADRRTSEVEKEVAFQSACAEFDVRNSLILDDNLEPLNKALKNEEGPTAFIIHGYDMLNMLAHWPETHDTNPFDRMIMLLEGPIQTPLPTIQIAPHMYDFGFRAIEVLKNRVANPSRPITDVRVGFEFVEPVLHPEVHA
jgi:DNA-binding LacI/PurR family transcriptional regulator